ncbi:MauE/DoxX family redox-associated membrane protein [Streptomyces sp. NPDC090442]|uniref:MauE/DoxX family redox-associated membrane protein n=1 Tax=Streptomyces sp. NPDC090442 TaxID=3365962 RepID=UPI0038264930
MGPGPGPGPGPNKWCPRLSLTARLILALTWCWAGWAKLVAPEEAAQAVRAFRILPETLVAPVAYGLPALEIGLAVLLLLGFRVRFAAALSALLLTAFTAALVRAWATGLSIDCGCFGGGGDTDPASTQYATELARDLGLLALSAWLVYRPASRWSLEVLAPHTG